MERLAQRRLVVGTECLRARSLPPPRRLSRAACGGGTSCACNARRHRLASLCRARQHSRAADLRLARPCADALRDVGARVCATLSRANQATCVQFNVCNPTSRRNEVSAYSTERSRAIFRPAADRRVAAMAARLALAALVGTTRARTVRRTG